MQRQAQRKWWSSSLLALSCAGCLVTNELDFEPARSLLTVTPVSPERVSPVPSVDSDECGPGEVNFVARYYYEDVGQDLTIYAYANDMQVSTGAFFAEADPRGSPDHRAPAICVDRRTLRNACNRVELFVSGDPDDLRANSLGALRANPRVSKATWFLIGLSADIPAGAAKPYTSFADCLPAEGGS